MATEATVGKHAWTEREHCAMIYQFYKCRHDEGWMVSWEGETRERRNISTGFGSDNGGGCAITRLLEVQEWV